MSLRKFIAFGKILGLLLLISYSVTARSSLGSNDFQNHKTLDFSKHTTLHKNMLQPQVVNLGVTAEHAVKLVNYGYGVLPYAEKSVLLLHPAGRTHLILQDADRCESVSPFLFPYHFFW